MSIIESDSQAFEPYARLMNILGDQLITDKKVAVIEIIKNSYDADAEKVDVRFVNMDNYGKSYLTELEQPYIEIEDDGDGMTLDIIKDVWLKPAAPNKLEKRRKKKNFTKKGRILQGEKGIGRFAIHKLGEKIEIFTKAKGQDEIKLVLDFTEYNPEKVDLFNQPPEDYKLLNEIKNNWYVYSPPEVIKKAKGTLIRIYRLRETWRENDFKELYKASKRLIPPYDPNAKEFDINFSKDFDINIWQDNHICSFEDVVSFENLIDDAPFKMKGEIDKEGKLTFNYKSIITNRIVKRTVSICDKEECSKYAYDLWSFEKYFSKKIEPPSCGGFRFSFYAYDLGRGNDSNLSKDKKQFIKDNFIYVIRDGVRVYPFGEPGYDWLELDKLRAVVKAGFFPSYNDIIGFIYINQDDNKFLKDSSNRQGMMNIDGAYDDFKYFSLSIAEILNAEINIDKEKRKIHKITTIKKSDDLVYDSFTSLKKNLEKIDDVETLKKANHFFETVKSHTDIMKDRMETVEDLAGLGMAVEKASHDSLMLLSKMRSNIKDFKVRLKNKDYKESELISIFNELDENLELVYDEMQIIQPLFKIQRKVIKDISVYETIEKVIKYFRRDFENKIEYRIIRDKDIIIKASIGLVLQVLINIVDNAIYWLGKTTKKKKEIIFKIDTSSSSVIIADNGPGITEEVAPYIFNEFFSRKSDGRGLGLYIAKELLMRIGSEISLIEDKKEQLSNGANFLIKINSEN
jgi:nitrogen-specific signal transduction histidine kinase